MIPHRHLTSDGLNVEHGRTRLNLGTSKLFLIIMTFALVFSRPHLNLQAVSEATVRPFQLLELCFVVLLDIKSRCSLMKDT